VLLQCIFLPRKWRSYCGDAQLRYDECHSLHGGYLRFTNHSAEDTNTEDTNTEDTKSDEEHVAKSDQ
jgi:hypothetical protein